MDDYKYSIKEEVKHCVAKLKTQENRSDDFKQSVELLKAIKILEGVVKNA